MVLFKKPACRSLFWSLLGAGWRPRYTFFWPDILVGGSGTCTSNDRKQYWRGVAGGRRTAETFLPASFWRCEGKKTHPPGGYEDIGDFDHMCSGSIWNPVVGKEYRAHEIAGARTVTLCIPGQHSCMSEPLWPGLCMHCLQPHHLELFVPPRSNGLKHPMTTRQRSTRLLIKRDGHSESANRQHLPDGE